MALDVAEHLSNKFLRSLDEADSQLSGSTFISDFLAIKNVVNQIKRPRPRTCSETIRLLYDLNDALEECRMVPHKGRDLNMRLFLFSPSVYVFIQKMKTRLNKIKQGLGNLAAAPQQKISNRGFSLVRPPQVIGFDDLAEKIEGFLLGSQGGSSTSSRTGFATIGVFGIAGVGKTTLVQKVLDSERVKAEFNPIIWLPFSGMREELQQLSRFSFETCIVDNNLGPSPSPMSTDIDGKIVGVKKLLEKLNQLLSGKRYLIVFDDVCHSQIHVEERLWQGLCKSRGGAIIVTSRSKEVVQKLVLEQNNLVLVEPLDRELCWLIFQDNIKNVDGDVSGSSQRETLEKIKEEIKDQCHGLPLAAKTLAESVW